MSKPTTYNLQSTTFLKIFFGLLLVVGCWSFVGHSQAFAQETEKCKSGSGEYCLLAPIPLEGGNKDETAKATISKYLQGLFMLTIGIATALAVIFIIIGGIQYLTSEVFTAKSAAKDTITNALVGLLMAISAWMILYTVNPKLLNFGLEIEPAVINKEQTPTPAPGTTPGTPTPAPGSPGTCTDCSSVTVPHKVAPAGCAAPGPCVINKALNTKLTDLVSKLSDVSLSLQVTESYPPTRSHKDPCHNNGTCVDANFKDRSKASDPQNIKKFIEAANQSGLRAVYEVESASRAAQIEAIGIPSDRVIVVSGITGEHFSIYMDGN